MSDVPVQPQTAEAIATSLVRVSKVMAAMKPHAPRVHDAVDTSHYPVLFCLAAEPRRVSAVAESIHSDVSTVSRQVSHLVSQGLVEKIVDPADARAQVLSISPQGREVITALSIQRGEWFTRLLSTWSDDEAQTFLHYLDKFVDALESFKAAHAGAPPVPTQTTTTTRSGA